eukprot:TRINITY_DN4287_c0_g4_i8.p2 TRINITY_DN4287_c0_g4~~TRINITY_DN4287_c0_g4_i8.p2  ORF type:complete len:243 (+),score=102.61 TRINITY_DN4287_c0_g4_i8:973-1701(+)
MEGWRWKRSQRKEKQGSFPSNSKLKRSTTCFIEGMDGSETNSEYNELEKKYESEMKRCTRELKEVREQRDDLGQRVAELLESKKLVESHNKALEIELAAARQDISTLMKVSDDFQEKFDILTDKEAEVNSKNREYTRMIQEINAEKDKYSLNERKFQREMDKLMEEHKDELQMKSDRYEKMMKVTKSGYEERLQRKNDELHTLKMANEELEERTRMLEDQLRDSSMRIEQLYKLEAERKTYL